MRELEHDFVGKWLGKPPKRVLDVGCGEFSFQDWRKRGFESWGVDFHNWSKDKRFRQEDARHMSFSNEFFDVVYAVSTVEHVGLGRYGDKDDIALGDRKAILEMARILKNNGIMLVTVPFGQATDKPKKHRVYDSARLTKLFSGFRIIKQEYWINIKKVGWRQSNVKEILDYTGGQRKGKWLGNVNLVVKKKT